MKKLLVIDTETGGLDPDKNSLLSLGAVVYHDGAIVDEFYSLVHEPEFLAEESALKVNNLTREQVERDGESPAQVVAALENMLLRHDMRSRVTLVAHNAPFDLPFLKRLYRLACKDWAKRFSYRALCTQNGALMLDLSGRIVLPGGSASLDNLCKLWQIDLNRSGGHNALDDARAAAMVLKKIVEVIRWDPATPQ